jgi:hypothetical protein
LEILRNGEEIKELTIKKGAKTMNEQEMITTIKLNQKKALKILGNAKATYAIEFTGKEQVDALKFLGGELLENALNFDTEQKLSILKIVGVSKQEIALELSQYLDEQRYDRWEKPYAIEAIKYLKHESNELLLNAPLYKNSYQINALTILGMSNAGIGYKVDSGDKLEIVKTIGRSNAGKVEPIILEYRSIHSRKDADQFIENLKLCVGNQKCKANCIDVIEHQSDFGACYASLKSCDENYQSEFCSDEL